MKGWGISDNPNHSIVTYILDETAEIQQLVDSTSKSNNFPVINLRMAETAKNHLSIYEWLSAIVNAEMVITDSFHGSEFSLLFNRPLLITGNKERGMSRFESLLEAVGFNFNAIDCKTSCFRIEKENYDKIKAYIKSQRSDCIKTLLTSLK